jgi:hypothetical protein
LTLTFGTRMLSPAAKRAVGLSDLSSAARAWKLAEHLGQRREIERWLCLRHHVFRIDVNGPAASSSLTLINRDRLTLPAPTPSAASSADSARERELSRARMRRSPWWCSSRRGRRSAGREPGCWDLRRARSALCGQRRLLL